jgi:hypothetical protein
MPPLARRPVMPSGGTEKGSVCIRKTNFRTLVKASSASPNCLRDLFSFRNFAASDDSCSVRGPI